jgi:hypothetical protein
MTKSTLITIVLILSLLPAYSEWIEQSADPETGLRTGIVRVGNTTFEIGPNVDLSGADLSGLDLSNANLIGALLVAANLSGTDLRGTDLNAADLSRANLSTSNLSDTNLGFAIWNTPDSRISRLEEELETAITERDERFTEDQIREMSARYTVGLNQEGNIQLNFNIFESLDMEAFVPFTVNPSSVSVKDGSICLEFSPEENSAFFRFSVGEDDGEPATGGPGLSGPDSLNLGTLSADWRGFIIDSLGSSFDTEIGLYDGSGALVAQNDDTTELTNKLQILTSRLAFEELAPGRYYVALGGYNTTFGENFSVVTIQSAGGDFVLNFPGGRETGNLAAETAIWFTFEVL